MPNLDKLKVIAFDAMGVIFIDPDDIKDILLPYVNEISNHKITLEDIRQWYFEMSKGEHESKTFWEEYLNKEPYPDVEIGFIKRLRLDPEFKTVLHLIKENYQVALLSNDVHEWSKRWRELHELEQEFDAIVVSGDPDIQVRKPNKLIYEKLINKFDFSPNNFMFIDDRLRNLKPASELGIITTLMDKFSQSHPYQADFKIKKLTDLLNII